jgi:hypothetical protein
VKVVEKLGCNAARLAGSKASQKTDAAEWDSLSFDIQVALAHVWCSDQAGKNWMMT